MAAKGHRPIRNTDRRSPAGRGAGNEAARLRPANRVTLPYYEPPRRRQSDILELAVPGEEQGPVRDVAVASFGETDLLEAIIGNDDRVRVADALMRANVWRQICALRIRSSTGGLYVGTGWFIGPRVVATAGHCVFLHKEGGWPTSIDVVPAKHGAAEPYGRVTATRFASVDGWVEEQSTDFDYGVIMLDDAALGRRLGNFEVRVIGDQDLDGTVAKISGYPADRDRAEYQYFHERPLMRATASRLLYDIDTFGGQSGSPIWRDVEGSGLAAIGIHTTGSLSGNSGTRISEPVLDNLAAWAEEG